MASWRRRSRKDRKIGRGGEDRRRQEEIEEEEVRGRRIGRSEVEGGKEKEEEVRGRRIGR